MTDTICTSRSRGVTAVEFGVYFCERIAVETVFPPGATVGCTARHLHGKFKFLIQCRASVATGTGVIH